MQDYNLILSAIIFLVVAFPLDINFLFFATAWISENFIFMRNTTLIQISTSSFDYRSNIFTTSMISMVSIGRLNYTNSLSALFEKVQAKL